MARVRRALLLVSVPREPLWRGLNMARGAYLRTSATPRGTSTTGPSAPSSRCSTRHGEVVEARSPFPWTMLLVRLRHLAPPPRRPRAPRPRYGRGARVLSVGIAPTGRRHVRVLLASPATCWPRSTTSGSPAVVGAVRDHLGHLPADRAAALAHDRRAPRARAAPRPPAAHRRCSSRPASRWSSSSSRWRCAAPHPGRRLRRLGRAVLGARRRRARLRRELLRPRLAGRAPAVRALRRARAAGVVLALPVRARRRGRDRPRPDRGGAGHGGGAVRLAGRRAAGASRGATRRRPARPPSEARCAARTAGASRLAVLAVMLAEQTLLNAAGAHGRRHRDRRRAGGLRVQRAADRARAAAALPVDPDLAAAPPRRPGGARGRAEFGRAIRVTVLAIAAFAGAVALGLLADRPVRDERPLRRRTSTTAAAGSRSSALGMGLHLVAGTLNQAALGPRAGDLGRRRLAVRRRALRRLARPADRSTTSCCGSRWATSGPRSSSAGSCSGSTGGPAGRRRASTAPAAPAANSSRTSGRL